MEDRHAPRHLSAAAVALAGAGLGSSPALLQIEELSHWFRRERRSAPGMVPPVLERVSLTVRTGEIVALLGPSGCGKSTLLNLAAGLSPIQQGILALEGQPIHGPDPRLGVVFQQPALLPWLSVHRNVEFGLTLRHSERLSRGARQERLRQALELVGLTLDGHVTPAQLSGGMAQRVALARVLVRRPKLLLLDEPFSALDAVTRAEMQDLLHRIVMQLGTGILIVTHDVEEAIELGDSILLMRRQPGTIEQQWPGIKGAGEQQKSALRAEIVDAMSALLKPRSP